MRAAGRIALLLVLAGAPGCAATVPSGEAPALEPPSGGFCVRGRASEGGVECPAFRASDGRLFALLGAPALPSGEALCLCGRPAEISICMQGEAVLVSAVGPADRCPAPVPAR